jgi:hypothetical protein
MKCFLKYTVLFWIAVVAVLALMIGLIRWRMTVDTNSYILAWQDKMDMLSATNREPSIVLFGGSNVAFGFHSQMIVDSIGMPVINAGLHAGMGLKFMMDECFPLLRKGDVLVFTPETASHFYGDTYYGGETFVTMFYLGMVPWHEISSKQVRRIIEQTPTFIMDKIFSPALYFKWRENAYQRTGFNRYGDMVWHWTGDSLRHLNAASPDLDSGDPFCGEALINVVQRLNDLKARGVGIVMFPPAADKMFFKRKSYRFSSVAQQLGAAGFEFPDSSGVEFVENEYTYDTQYHLNKYGSEQHTRHLIAWLRQSGF